ncbi:sugar transferase [Candidatus Uhrbacteria bacterium]|nr:sugar transferase [Candidatus Uhrbacteria bacterium]
MKRSDLFFAAILVPIDFLLLVAAGFAAYFLRFGALQDIQPVIYQIPFFTYMRYVFGVSIFAIGIFASTGLYHFGHYRIQNEIPKIFTACSTSIMLVIVFIFFIKELFTSRFIVLAAWFLCIAFVATGRLILRAFRLLLFNAGYGINAVAVIGSDTRTTDFMLEVSSRPWLGYRILIHAHHLTDEIKIKIQHAARDKKLDDILLIDESLSASQLRDIVQFADINHVSLRYSADSIGEKNIEIETVLGLPLVHLKRTRLDGWGRIIKRMYDILGGIFLTMLFLPIGILVALAIIIESRGPIIYKNIRVGQDGKHFETYKFRSMYKEYCTGPQYDEDGKAEQYQKTLVQSQSQRKGPVFKVLRDPRRTCVGRFLERTSLDELPQFLNVLRGNMSLVGPRPHMPSEVAGYENHHHQLFRVKPGITGVAQIRGRSDLNFEDEARLDIYYIEHWSLLLDFIILIKTPYAVLARALKV